MNNYKEYKNLLSKTYHEAVDFLLQKYGFARDDYYRENSYDRFINGEIKNITKGKYSRTSEGLYCHHIDEIKELKISDQSFVKRNKIPFEYQKKDRLVYCDLVEHTILHVLITKETSFKFGYPGLFAHLLPIMFDWYILEIIPELKWQKHCYDKSYITPNDAFKILKEIQLTIDEIPLDNKNINALVFRQSKLMEEITSSNSIAELYEYLEKKEEERIKLIKERNNRIEEAERNNRIEEAKLLHDKSPRKDILESIYYLKYKDEIYRENAYKEFDRKMKKYPKDQILEELKIYLEDLSKIDDESSK